MYCARWLFISIVISISSLEAQETPVAAVPEKQVEPGPQDTPSVVPPAKPVEAPMTSATVATPVEAQRKEPAGTPSIPAPTQPPVIAVQPTATSIEPVPTIPPTLPGQPVVVPEKVQELPAGAPAQLPTEPQVTPAQPATPVPAVTQPEVQPVQPEKKVEEKPAEKPIEYVEPKRELITTPPLSEDEITGIDTVDLEEPQGNWLFKRVWWERAESKYEKLRASVNLILEFRMAFFAKRSELDKSVLDPFYIAIGLTQGELQEILKTLIDRLEQERAQEGVLDEKERELLSNVQQELDTLKQLQKDVENILKLDHDVDEALAKLMEHINQIRGYEQDAWKNFKEIARVLNDKKARELFYRIDTDWRNVNELQQYIMGAFGPHYDQLVTKIQDHISAITTMIQTLKTKGIDFKKQAEMLKRGQRKPTRTRQPVEEEIQEEQGFIGTYIVSPIKNAVSALWNGIVSIVRWPYEKIFGPTEQNQEEVDENGQPEPTKQDGARGAQSEPS